MKIEGKSKEVDVLLRDLEVNEIIDYKNSYFKKEYHKMDEGAYILKVAKGSLGSVQDGYIIYAIGALGVCTERSLYTFLNAYQNKNKMLAIGFSNSEDTLNALHPFLMKFLESGLIIRFWFMKNENTPQSAETGYCLTNKGLSFCKSIIQKNLHLRSNYYLCPESEILGLMDMSKISSKIAKSVSFLDVSERELVFPVIDKMFVPCVYELKHKNEKIILSFWSLYFDKNPAIHTDRSFIEYKTKIVNDIIFFLNYRTKRNTKGIAAAVIYVKDIDELIGFIEYLSMSRDVDEALPHIYITCNQILSKNYKLYQSFISLKRDEENQIIPCFKEVPFLKG